MPSRRGSGADGRPAALLARRDSAQERKSAVSAAAVLAVDNSGTNGEEAASKARLATVLILCVNIVCSSGNYILVKYFMKQKASFAPDGDRSEQFMKTMDLPLTLSVVAHFIPSLLLFAPSRSAAAGGRAGAAGQPGGEEDSTDAEGRSSDDDEELLPAGAGGRGSSSHGARGDDYSGGASASSVPWGFFSASACCLMFGHLLAIVSLKGLMPSVAYMLKGTRVVFTGLLSRCFLQTRLRAHHWLGIGVLVVGFLVLVVASLFSRLPGGGEAQKASGYPVGLCLGVGLVSQFLASVQFVLQEGGFRRAPQLSSKKAVGVESGMACLLACAGLAWFNLRGRERVADTYHQFMNEPWFFLLFPMVFVCIIVSHVSGMLISKKLSAQTRTMADVVKVCITWVFEPFILHGNGARYFAAQPLLSLLGTGVGYCVMVYGLLLYTEVATCACGPGKKQRALSTCTAFSKSRA